MEILPRKLSAIIKVTENCNYECEFCFYAQCNEKKAKVMNLDLCKKIMLETVKYNTKNNIYSVNFIFHGGEPLLVGIQYFIEIMKYENELKERFNLERIENCIQTNASLINDEWIEFFKDNKFSVGISLDGDSKLNNHFKNKNDDKNLIVRNTIEKYHKLLNVGVDVGILSVITNKHIKEAKRFYNFIKENNIKHIGILPCVNDSSNDTLIANEYGGFLKELFDLYFYGEYEVSIREFDIAIEKAIGSSIVRNCANCNRQSCGSFLTYDTQGNVFFCDYAYNKERKIGNINKDNIVKIVLSKSYSEEQKKCNKFMEFCEKCDVKDICACSCYRNDIIDSNGKIINRFCDAFKSFYPYLKEIVKKIEKNNQNY